MCGENPEGCIVLDNPPGSPPRVRGKQVSALVRRVDPGITPACAGKTSEYIDYIDENGDHPRVCGENRSD